ncbi:MAG: hypothetical protein AB1434_10000 [Pseudomonadota bacterium]
MHRLARWAAWLVLPLTALLFLQWPLREWVQRGSTLANDAGQVLFAFYVSVAITAATRAHAHLGTHMGAEDGPMLEGGWRLWALRLCLLPWSVYVLTLAAPAAWQSLLQLERFPESFNAGYFLIRIATVLLVLLVLIDLLRPRRRSA